MITTVKYIANGPTAVVGANDHIAVSQDGTNWDLITKTALSIGLHTINLPTSAPNSHVERNRGGVLITLKRSDNEGPILTIDPFKIVEIDGLTATTTPETLATAQAIKDEISSWL
jgi:hypothetical protein